MSQYSDYSLSGCLIDKGYSGPKLASEMGADPRNFSGQPMPPVVDLRRWCTPVEDQGKHGTCVANAAVGALELLRRQQGRSSQDLSRLFVYYNSRKLHDFDYPSGTYVHTAMAAILLHGVCEERMWPYSDLSVDQEPTRACYDNADLYRGIEFAEIEYGTPLTHVLNRGIPVVINIDLPREAYDRAQTSGVLQVAPGTPIGGSDACHSMLVVGFDLEQGAYIVRNSWGEHWGNGGYALLPFALFEMANTVRGSWAIGSLGSAPGLRLLGQSVPDSVQAVAGAAIATPQPMQQDPGKALRDEVQGDIDRARSGFASRLRDR